MKFHPLVVGNVASYGCDRCSHTGVVNDSTFPDRRVSCTCVNYRESDDTPVPSLQEAIREKYKLRSEPQVVAQRHDNVDPAVEAMSQSLVARLARK